MTPFRLVSVRALAFFALAALIVACEGVKNLSPGIDLPTIDGAGAGTATGGSTSTGGASTGGASPTGGTAGSGGVGNDSFGGHGGEGGSAGASTD